LLGPASVAAASPKGSGVPRLIFPVVGPVSYTDDFGQPRGTGKHEGNDLMAGKRQLAVAVEAGTVGFWTTSVHAGCMLYLHGESGTMYEYIHLNNDLTAGNDNKGKCVAGTAYAKGLKDGQHVEAGQPVGYVGDSGDANGIASHLHFEVHPREGKATSPFPFLAKAQHLLFAAPPGAEVSVALKGTLLTADGVALGMQVQALRVSTGLRVAKVNRLVTLSIDPGLATDGLLLGGPVRVTTSRAPVSLEQALGADGALVAKIVAPLAS
jgi:hypothetical protein